MSSSIVMVGGSRGIGFEVARRLAGAGNEVHVFSRTPGRLDEVPGIVRYAFDASQDEFDGDQLPDNVDGLVYCPGTINLGSIRSLTAAGMLEDFRLNVLGAVSALQACLPKLKNSKLGSVVLFSTVAVQRGFAMHSRVAAAKGAIEGLTRTWAAELAPTIRVNCIAPGLTDTPLAERLLASEERQQKMATLYPLKRYGQPEDVAAAATFLLSKDSDWVTGQVLHVDGGASSLNS